MINKVFEYFGIKSNRTENIAKHVGLSLFYKGFSILANLLLVPLTLDYLTVESYGLWLTLSSFIAWFGFFDVGLGHGLRNKFAEAIADNKPRLARAYVSCAYYTIASVSILLILFFVIINFFIDWTAVFNAHADLKSELSILMPVVFSFFCLQLVMKLITTIYIADQKPSMQGKVQLFSQVTSLLIIWLLTKTSSSSLLLFGAIFSALPVVILFLFNLVAFNNRYSDFKPMWSLWKKEYLMEIFGLGINFFIIQIAALILYSTDNFIISKLFSPAEVAPYNIAYKYFTIILMGYTIIVSPYWSSFTEAYLQKDYQWIKVSVRNVMKMWLCVPFLLIVMVFLADWFYLFWIGDKITVALSLNISIAIFVALMTFEMVFVSFINGVGKIKLQLYTSILMMVINIPLSILLAKNMGLGVSGVILATSISLLFTAVLRPVQYFKIINNRAVGIWNR